METNIMAVKTSCKSFLRVRTQKLWSREGHLPCGTGFVGMKGPWAAADKRPQLKAESPPCLRLGAEHNQHGLRHCVWQAL